MLELAGVMLVNPAMPLSAEFWLYIDANEHGHNLFYTFY